MRRIILLFAVLSIHTAGCASLRLPPDLGALYTRLAQYHGVDRNPVIVIPGVMGSKLHDSETGRPVWGAFTGEYINPRRPEGARLAALPMQPGSPLEDLRDSVESVGALARLEIAIFGLPIELSAYANILRSLGAGGYRDQDLGTSGAVDYGDDHFTCFQFHYDWRRSNVENSHALGAFIQEKKAYVKEELSRRFGVEDPEVRFDIVAHSMGGLLTRYFLRYGSQSLPTDGSPPTLDWSGAQDVENVILVGSPNAGSVQVLRRILAGLKLGPVATYPAAIVGTFPSMYELMPRTRHGAVVNEADPSAYVDIYDPAVWQSLGWGLADPRQEKVLAVLLPDAEGPEARERIALDHLEKCLARAKQFHAALDVPASPPQGLKILLFAGDAEDTETVLGVNVDTGRVITLQSGPGDGTVARSSALMDERIGGAWQPRLESPIDWDHVTFVFQDHLGMTRDEAFIDNVLYYLLEKPQDPAR